MNKEKWLSKEIEAWQQETLIDGETAQKIKDRYAERKSVNGLSVLFSIIGALLVGAGVVLIGARNWAYFPLPLRAAVVDISTSVYVAFKRLRCCFYVQSGYMAGSGKNRYNRRIVGCGCSQESVCCLPFSPGGNR